MAEGGHHLRNPPPPTPNHLPIASFTNKIVQNVQKLEKSRQQG